MATSGQELNPSTVASDEEIPPTLSHENKTDSDMLVALQRELADLRIELNQSRKTSHALYEDIRPSPSVFPTRIVLPPPVKLPVYSGREDPSLWINRAKRTIDFLQLQGKEAVLFLRDYLQGTAEEEAKQQLPDTPDFLFSSLNRVFGSRASSAQVMRDFYTRIQSPSESVTDYSHALVSILEKTGLPFPERELLVRDQFAEGIKPISLQRLLKRRIRDRPSVTFSQLRDIALDESAETPKVQVKEQSVEYACNIVKSDNSFVDPPPAWAKELMELTKQLLSSKSVVSPTPLQCDPPIASQTSQIVPQAPKPRIQCYYCEKYGHVRRDCRKRLRDERQGPGGSKYDGHAMSNQGGFVASRSLGTNNQL